MSRLSKEDVRAFLASETLFRSTSPAAIERLADLALQRVVPKDHVLFTMGQQCEALHFVVEGCGLLVKTAPDGRQRILHRAVPGEMVGAVPFFDGRGYPAAFVAETEVVVVSFPRQELLKLFRDDSALALAIVGGLVDRLRMMAGIVEQLSFEDAEHRLWDYLLERSSAEGGSGFPRVFDPLPTREHIASAIGTVREVVSRRLSRLVDSGHIRIEGRRLVLLKPLE
jgi:CRP/FNR family transcriptional regulator